MNTLRLAWHITKKDVRTLRWLIVLWAALTVLQAVLRVVWPPMMLEVHLNTTRVVQSARDLLPLVRGLLFTEIVVLLIQADPLVTADAFWLTRPIAPRVLFFSKLLTAALTLIVPTSLTQVVLMLAFGVPVLDIAHVIPEMLLYTTTGMAIVLIAAALTANQRALIAWTAGLFILVTIVSVGISSVMPDGPRFEATETGEPTAAARAARRTAPRNVDMLIVAQLLFTSAFAGSAWHLYRTRRRGQSALIAAATGGAALIIVTVWPTFDLSLEPYPVPLEKGIALGAGMHYTDGAGSLSVWPTEQDQDGRCRALARVTRLKGLRTHSDRPRLHAGFVHRPTGQELASHQESTDRLADDLSATAQFSDGEFGEAFEIRYSYVWITAPKFLVEGKGYEPVAGFGSVSCRDVDVSITRHGYVFLP